MRVSGRVRRALGDHFGLTHFEVNLTRLPPGGMSALRHTIRARMSSSTSSRAKPHCVPAYARASRPARQCASSDQPHRARDAIWRSEIATQATPSSTHMTTSDGRWLRIFVHTDGRAYRPC